MATERGRSGGTYAAATFRANRNMQQEVVNSPELRAVLTMLALRVERLARVRAPIDTGRLRNSITHRISPLGRELAAEIGTNVEYAAAQEFGTRDGHVPPRRYLGSALQEVARQLGGTM